MEFFSSFKAWKVVTFLGYNDWIDVKIGLQLNKKDICDSKDFQESVSKLETCESVISTQENSAKTQNQGVVEKKIDAF